MSETELVFHEVDAERWDDFERLFGARGGPKSCWCMIWRAQGEEARKTDSDSRRAGIERRVRDGVPVGILAYADDEPIGWCSIAPRESYRPGLADAGDESDEGIWSLACLFVPRARRGEGLSRRLIEAAIEHARRAGAAVVEAYPVDPDSPSYRFMGFVETFREFGFDERGRVGRRRHVMRLPLESAKG